MRIKEMAEEMGYEVLHGIVDCLWVIGEPISAFKEAVERETGILTEVDTYDWTFLPMSDGGGAYNCCVFTGNHLAHPAPVNQRSSQGP